MATSVVLTVIGEDRPGLVEALSRTVTAHDGNWLESRMAHMAGKFAGIVRVELPEGAVAGLVEALVDLGAEGLKVTAEPSPSVGRAAEPFRTLTLELVGSDHPGIVRDVAQALSRRGVNVEELDTERTSAPMSGEPLFRARARLGLPPDVSGDELRKELERVAHSLMVDLTLEEPVSD